MVEIGEGVALVVAGRMDAVGGEAMRWRALHRAIAVHGPCLMREIQCDRWRSCRRTCTATDAARRGPLPLVGERSFCPDYAERLAVELQAHGIRTVVLSGTLAFPYAERLAAADGLSLVIDMHNVDAVLHDQIRRAAPPRSLFGRMIRAEDVERLLRLTRTAVRAADEIWTCSDEDRTLLIETFEPELRGRAGGVIRTVPNVVELPGSAPDFDRSPERVAFTGRIDWLPNFLAARCLVVEVTPALRRRGCDVPVVVAGAGLDAVRDELPAARDVQFVSDPESTADIIERSIMAVPLTLGGGSRLKILQAFAAGAPVVATAKAIEGIAAVPGRHYLLAEDAEALADAVIRLLREPDLRRHLTANAWDLVGKRYSVPALVDLLTPSGPESPFAPGTFADGTRAAPAMTPSKART